MHTPRCLRGRREAVLPAPPSRRPSAARERPLLAQGGGAALSPNLEPWGLQTWRVRLWGNRVISQRLKGLVVC